MQSLHISHKKLLGEISTLGKLLLVMLATNIPLVKDRFQLRPPQSFHTACYELGVWVLLRLPEFVGIAVL